MDDSKKVELSERNVLSMFKECLDTSKQPINCIDLFLPGAKQKPAVIYLEQRKIIPRYDEILYMLGQLQEVHQKNKFILFGKGTFNYKNDKWSNSNASLYALYYLGMAAHCMTGFNLRDGKISAKMLNAVEPTFYPPEESEVK